MSRPPRYWLLALSTVAVPILTTALLSSCKLVDEPIVGLVKKGVGHCVKDCRHEFLADERECLKELRQDRRGCRNLSDEAAREACFRELVEDFVTCTRAAFDERRDCLNDCHRQGRGNAN